MSQRILNLFLNKAIINEISKRELSFNHKYSGLSQLGKVLYSLTVPGSQLDHAKNQRFRRHFRFDRENQVTFAVKFFDHFESAGKQKFATSERRWNLKTDLAALTATRSRERENKTTSEMRFDLDSVRNALVARHTVASFACSWR